MRKKVRMRRQCVRAAAQYFCIFQIPHRRVKGIQPGAPRGKGGLSLVGQPAGAAVQTDHERVARRARLEHVQLALDPGRVGQIAVQLQKRGLGQAGQRLVGALHDQIGPCGYGPAAPAVPGGKGQVVRTVGLVHQQRHAAGVADFRDSTYIAQNTLISRAGQDHAAGVGRSVQRGGHIGGAHTAVDAKLRVHGRREPAGRQLPQLNRVVDGLVAVARRNDRAAERCQCADARQQADGGPADEVPAPPRAVQRRRAGHGVGQNAVRVVQVVRTVDLGQVPGIAAQPRCGRHPPLMPGHVQRVTRRGEGFQLLLQR